MGSPANAITTSIVIAAHNEEAVIGRCLDLLLSGLEPHFEVIVVPNGCSDNTASIARSRGVLVVDLEDANKSAALNAGDAIASGDTRIYLDADVGATARTATALTDAFDHDRAGGAPLLAVPERRVVVSGRPWPVRYYYAIQTRLPAARDGAFGRGMVAISAQGRKRFDRFPDAIADDLFLDSLFRKDERTVVTEVLTLVEAPARTRDLIRRLTRVRRGNMELRNTADHERSLMPSDVRRSSRLSWFRDVVVKEPRLVPAGLVFAIITVIAEVRARQGHREWATDRSSSVEGEA